MNNNLKKEIKNHYQIEYKLLLKELLKNILILLVIHRQLIILYKLNFTVRY